MAASGEHHRGLFHHHKMPEGEFVQDIEIDATATPHDLKAEIKRHARKEHLGEAAAILGGAVAVHEKHRAKKDPENAHKHHIGEAIAGAVAAGAGAYALHERHQKKDAEKEGKHHRRRH